VQVPAALAPGTTILQSFCFLSQGLCVPVLIAFLAAVVRLSRGGNLHPLPCAVATFALGFAVYTEFVPLFLGAAGVALTTGLITGAIGTPRIAAVASGFVVAVLLSPAAAVSAVNAWQQSLGPGARMTLSEPVPVWAACLWVNSDSAYRTIFARYAIKVRALVAVSFILAAAGAAALVFRTLRWNRAALPAAAGAASLLVPPVALWAIRPESTYVISKLVWTAAPVLVLLVACWAQALGAAARRSGLPGSAARGLVFGVLASLAGFWVYHTVLEQSLYLDPADGHSRTARLWNEPALHETCAMLRDLPPTDVLVDLSEDAPPSIAATALCFHGRQHRFWIASPHHIWWAPLNEVPTPQLTDLRTCPPGALVVLPSTSAPPGAEIVFRNERYVLIRNPVADR
jgi:hypothetical protein